MEMGLDPHRFWIRRKIVSALRPKVGPDFFYRIQCQEYHGALSENGRPAFPGRRSKSKGRRRRLPANDVAIIAYHAACPEVSIPGCILGFPGVGKPRIDTEPGNRWSVAGGLWPDSKPESGWVAFLKTSKGSMRPFFRIPSGSGHDGPQQRLCSSFLKSLRGRALSPARYRAQKRAFSWVPGVGLSPSYGAERKFRWSQPWERVRPWRFSPIAFHTSMD